MYMLKTSRLYMVCEVKFKYCNSDVKLTKSYFRTTEMTTLTSEIQNVDAGNTCEVE